ncbi:hypothetical protein HK44_007545 [Pseudomonas fluorescens HK44]|uniref:Lipoprotein n=1 Tax=Pseudomonas fluorescens HK44 TaxID=1042209 RepID=A0A010SR52_PSEFL|nr:hypothetical protein HK44_007545 [Pseudomonas fluorescens HK44]
MSDKDFALPLPGFKVLALALAVFGLSACSSIHAHTTEYAGAQHTTATSPNSVQILRTPPTRPYTRLGEVILHSSTQPAPPVNEFEQRLREEAAKIGGDAVVVIYDMMLPISAYVSAALPLNRDFHTEQRRKLKGIVIHYE